MYFAYMFFSLDIITGLGFVIEMGCYFLRCCQVLFTLAIPFEVLGCEIAGSLIFTHWNKSYRVHVIGRIHRYVKCSVVPQYDVHQRIRAENDEC
jgi:hypothetical protein